MGGGVVHVCLELLIVICTLNFFAQLQVAHVICPLCQVVGASTKVLSTSLLCMSELCRSIGPHMIPLLPTLLPTVLKHLGGAYDKARYVHMWTTDVRMNVVIVAIKWGSRLQACVTVCTAELANLFCI